MILKLVFDQSQIRSNSIFFVSPSGALPWSHLVLPKENWTIFEMQMSGQGKAMKKRKAESERSARDGSRNEEELSVTQKLKIDIDALREDQRKSQEMVKRLEKKIAEKSTRPNNRSTRSSSQSNRSRGSTSGVDDLMGSFDRETLL